MTSQLTETPSRTPPAKKSWCDRNTLLALSAVIITMSVLTIPRKAAAAVLLKGSYSYQYLEPAQTVNREIGSHGEFVVLLGADRWVITYKSKSAITNSKALYSNVEASYDGENCFVVAAVNPLILPPPSGAHPVVTLEARVYPGDCPPPIERDIYNLWVAFVAPSVWTNSSGTAKPPNAPDLSLFYHDDFVCYYSWERDMGNGTDRQFTLRSGGRILTRDIRDNGQLKRIPLGSPYQNGYTMAVGRWIASTNAGGLDAPLKFDYSYFSPKRQGASEEDLILSHTYQCEVSHTSFEQFPAIPVGLQGERLVMITDNRPARDGLAPLTYFITNRWSYAVGDKILRGLASAKPQMSLEASSLEQHGFVPKQSFLKTFLKEIFIVTVIAFPVVWFAARAALRKKATHQTTNQ